MRLWQQAMIRLALRKDLQRYIQTNAGLSGLAIRFVGGADPAEATARAQQLKAQGLSASLFYLGEYVHDAAVIRQTVLSLQRAAGRLAEAGLDVHLSVDPTQIGYLRGEDYALQNILAVARAIQETVEAGQDSRHAFLMLDMEDYTVVDATLEMYRALRLAKLPAAVTLQAYLYRTRDDLARLIAKGAAVRLVKGAFAESKKVAWTSRRAITANFLDLACTMLSPGAYDKGVYPIFATHDDKLIDALIKIARANGWPSHAFEFEMLYGVRPGLQQRLVRKGWQVRLYVPFGVDWWPYAVRRVGESRKNAFLLLRALF